MIAGLTLCASSSPVARGPGANGIQTVTSSPVSCCLATYCPLRSDREDLATARAAVDNPPDKRRDESGSDHGAGQKHLESALRDPLLSGGGIHASLSRAFLVSRGQTKRPTRTCFQARQQRSMLCSPHAAPAAEIPLRLCSLTTLRRDELSAARRRAADQVLDPARPHRAAAVVAEARAGALEPVRAGPVAAAGPRRAGLR